jgi:hypothetical protein
MMVKKRRSNAINPSGAIGQGEGARAGVAYRMKDGSIVYVPESASSSEPAPGR